jgi:hypothetical protein
LPPDSTAVGGSTAGRRAWKERHHKGKAGRRPKQVCLFYLVSLLFFSFFICFLLEFFSLDRVPRWRSHESTMPPRRKEDLDINKNNVRFVYETK